MKDEGLKPNSIHHEADFQTPYVEQCSTLYPRFRRIANIDDTGISVEQFGKQAADRYFLTLEVAMSRIVLQPDLLRAEESFHETLRFYRIEKYLLECETKVAGKIIILAVVDASMDTLGISELG